MWCGVVWFGVVAWCVVWCGVVLCGVVWYGVVRCGGAHEVLGWGGSEDQGAPGAMAVVSGRGGAVQATVTAAAAAVAVTAVAA